MFDTVGCPVHDQQGILMLLEGSPKRPPPRPPALSQPADRTMEPVRKNQCAGAEPHKYTRTQIDGCNASSKCGRTPRLRPGWLSSWWRGGPSLAVPNCLALSIPQRAKARLILVTHAHHLSSQSQVSAASSCLCAMGKIGQPSPGRQDGVPNDKLTSCISFPSNTDLSYL